MPGIRHGVASWGDQSLAVESASYTASHGTAPGTAVLVVQPTTKTLAVHGTLKITDGTGTIALPGCRLDDLTVSKGADGEVWNLRIVDRRWRWRDLGGIDGVYNQLDPQGKLIPWTIRSPTELATLCLLAMGEVNFVLDGLPPGLDSSVGQAIQTMLPTGINYPPTGTNPPVNWNATPPAQALQEIAEKFGCRVVYRCIDDVVMVTKAGVGDTLPMNVGVSIFKLGPSIKNPETPDAVGVVGAPTRYQMRLRLEAVGLEWDGRYRPIDDLSYAPSLPGKVQIVTGTVTYDGTTPGLVYEVTLLGVPYRYITVGGETADAIAAALAATINAAAALRGIVTASAAGGVLTLTGQKEGDAWPYDIVLTGIAAGCAFEGALIQVATKKKKGWNLAYPPVFAGIQATDRLTLRDARELAQRSVWKCYRVVNQDASGKGAIKVPGYTGQIVRRFQLEMQDTQVDQVVPSPGDENLVIPDGAALEPFIADLYRGLSRDKRAVVIGEVSLQCFAAAGVFHFDLPANTPRGTVLPFTFATNAVEQVITFHQPVFFLVDNELFDPDLVWQGAVLVRDAETNQFDAFKQVVPLPGQSGVTNPKLEVHQDVQVNVTSTYDLYNNIQSASILEADPLLRASYYLAGMTQQYVLSLAQTVGYNGLVPIQLDGAIAQVTWSVGPSGAETIASRNSEHDVWVPPYPARRRPELLDAVRRFQDANDKKIHLFED